MFCLAKQVTKEQSLNIAQQFYSEQKTSKIFKVKAATAPEFKLDYISTDDAPKTLKSRALVPALTDSAAYFYVYNIGDKQGFIIVSGDDRTKPILGYSDEGAFTFENIPEHVKDFLDNYKTQIKAIMQSNDTTAIQKVMKVAASNDSAVAPLITTKWGQDSPYNSKIPITAPTGCVATAMAQVMNYYKWPVTGTSSHSYNYNGQNFSADFGSTTYDWANMLNLYFSFDNITTVNSKAVATLMYHCGVSLEMQYATTGSGALTTSISDALINYFGYDKDLKYITYDVYSPNQWKYQMILEINAKRPVIIDGRDATIGNHTFIADGYDSYDFIHINWGWDGYYNGYFEISPIDANTYWKPKGMIIGIQKPTISSEISLEYSGYNLNYNTSLIKNQSINTTFNIVEENNRSFNGKIGLAFYKNEAMYKIIDSTTFIINSGSILTNSFTINISDTLSLGTYRLVPIFKSANSKTWSEIKFKNATLPTDTRINENVEFEVSGNDIMIYQNSKTMNCKKGDFKNNFSYADWKDIQRLVVSGKIEQWDILYMAGGKSIKTIDMKNASILSTKIKPSELSYGSKPANFDQYIATLSSKWKNIQNSFWHGIQYKEGDPNWEKLKDNYTFRGVHYDPITKTYYATYDKNPIDVSDPNVHQDNIQLLGSLEDYTVDENGYPTGAPKKKNVQQSISNNVVDSFYIGGRGIMADAFSKSTIENITLPSNLKYIAPMAFANCPNLKSITIPDSVILIGDSLFSNCPNLNEIKFSRNLKNLWNQPFSNLKKLTSVILSDSLLCIENNAFKYCFGLTSISIPSSVKSIGINAFMDCTSLTSINVDDNNTNYSSSDGVLYDKAKTTLIQCPIPKIGSFSIPPTVTTILDDAFAWCNSLISVTIPSSVKSIGNRAFHYCNGLLSVTIPASVIGDNAFESCSSLTSINFLSTVTSIGNDAFNGCIGLIKVIIPNSVKSIGNSAFYRCEGLNSINLPNSVTTIGSYAFCGCIKLVEIVVQSGNPNYSSKDGVLFNKNKTTLIQYPSGRTGDYIIPNSVTYFGSAFSTPYNGTELTGVTIPNSITKIETCAFRNCGKLKKVFIPNSVTVIGDAAFSYCGALESIMIPSAVTSIGSDAFHDCSGLMSIYAYPNTPITNLIYSEFYLINKNSCILYVPKGSKLAYQTAYFWKDFKEIVEMNDFALSTNNLTMSVDGNSLSTSFTTNTSWTASSDQNWLTIGSPSGSGDGILTLTASPNIGISRIALVTVLPIDASPQTIIVKQLGAPKSINLTAGNLLTVLTNDELDGISDLTISGTIDARDFKTMRDDMTNLAVLDLSGANIVSYSGANGPSLSKALGAQAKIKYVKTELDDVPNKFVVTEAKRVVKSTAITYPANEIPEDAFYNNATADRKTTLNTVILPTSLTSIGNDAFMNTSLTTINFPITLLKIGDWAFSGCSSLVNVSFPSSVQTIGYAAFLNTKLSTVNLANCSYMKTISDYTFQQCSLTNVTLPKSIESIGQYAFSMCPNINMIDLNVNTSLNTISDFAFWQCANLDNIKLSNSVDSIGYGIVLQCGKLTNIAVDSDNHNLSSSDGVLFDKNQTKLICYSPGKSETKYIFPSTVMQIGDAAFRACNNLTSIDATNSSLKKIGISAFYSTPLAEVYLPGTLTTIGTLAFKSCTKLQLLKISNAVPPILGINVFYLANTTTSLLNVPAGSKSAYKTASQWKDFTNIAEIVTALPDINNTSFSLYLNPIDAAICVKGINGTGTLKLFDINGRQLLSKQVANNESVPVSSLSQGVYLVKLITAEGTTERKIIK